MSEDCIEVLAESRLLHERLVSCFGSVPRKRIIVGLAWRDRCGWAVLDDEPDTRTVTDAAVVRIGCISKLLTAALLERAVADGHLDWHSNLSDLLYEQPQRVRAELSRIAAKDLLEHTHGLDDSLVWRVPRRAGGWIDLAALCAQLLLTPRLTEPGTMYSYSNAGAWLCAALLERIYGRRYADMLCMQLLAQPAGAAAMNAERICPASGDQLALHASALLQFLAAQFAGAGTCFGSQPGIVDEVVPLSGWNSLELGVRRAWKYAGGGWFGHSSMLPGHPVLLRVHPQRRIGVFIASRYQAPAIVAAGLFGKHLPELSALRTPKPLTQSESQRIDVARYLGIYKNAAQTMVIDRQGSQLALRVDGVRDPLWPESSFGAELRPARDHIFLTRPLHGRFPYVQCVLDGAGQSQYLWNGQRLWRRQSNQVC